MNSPASTLVISGVEKDFGLHRVLRGIDLTVNEGEYVALMGTNGAGKTTLLRMLAGLSRPTQGQVTLAGIDLRRAGPGLRRRIGFVSHESLLYPDLTGRENLEFHAKLFGVEDVDKAIAALDEVLDLAPILDRPAGILSRGNRQRLTLARALMHAPRVLLLDEPFTGLDEASTERLLRILQQLVDDGRTVIMTTHDRNIVEAGPRRLIVIADGKVSEDRELTPKSSAPSAAPAYLRPNLVNPPARFRSAAAIAAKDLKVELRTRDLIGSSGLFALCVLITTSFTMPSGDQTSGMATGVMWISILFATLLGVGRSMGRETADRGIEGMLLSPAARDAIFVGKAAASFILMMLIDLMIVLVFLVLLAGDASTLNFLPLILTVFVGTLGLVLVGSLFSGIAVGSRLGESILPMLVMPVAIPLMIGAVELTRQSLGADTTGLWVWLGLLSAFDFMAGFMAVVSFVYVIEE